MSEQAPVGTPVPAWGENGVYGMEGGKLGQSIICHGCSGRRILCGTVVWARVWDEKRPQQQIKRTCIESISDEAALAIRQLLAQERDIKLLKVVIPSLNLELKVTIQNGH